MKYSLAIIIFIFSFSSLSSTIDFNLIYDLDYTLVQEVDKNTPKSFKLNFDGKYYKVNNWALEGIEVFKAHGVSIHFFSGGQKERNIELLEKIKLSNGLSLKEIANNIWSKSDLDPASTTGRFGERYKKNLLKLNLNLSKSLLIDDYFNFVPKNQIDNLLWIGKTYYYFDTYAEAQHALRLGKFKAEYIPQSYDEWFIAKNKFKFVNELILDAVIKSPMEIKSHIQNYKDIFIPYEEKMTQDFLKVYGPLKAIPNPCFEKYRYFK